MSQAYGQIYVADGSTSQVLLVATPAKMTGFATEGPASDDLTGDLSVVPDAANDKITVKSGGIYRVDYNISGSMVDQHSEVEAAVRVGGVEEAGSQSKSAFSDGTETVSTNYPLTENSMSGCCIIEPTADADVEIYLESSVHAGFVPSQARLLVTRIG